MREFERLECTTSPAVDANVSFKTDFLRCKSCQLRSSLFKAYGNCWGFRGVFTDLKGSLFYSSYGQNAGRPASYLTARSTPIVTCRWPSKKRFESEYKKDVWSRSTKYRTNKRDILSNSSTKVSQIKYVKQSYVFQNFINCVKTLWLP